jgi:acyl carrier protein
LDRFHGLQFLPRVRKRRFRPDFSSGGIAVFSPCGVVRCIPMPDRSPAVSLESAPTAEEPWPETLKRLPPPTLAAARLFRQTGNPRYLPAIVRGILAGQVEDGRRRLLDGPSATLRLSEDLAIDSLALLEIALVLEDAVGFPLPHGELRHCPTVGEIERALAARVSRSASRNP